MSTLQTKFVSVPEAGRRIGKSPQTVKRLIARGQLDAVQIPGCHTRVAADQVEAFVPARLRCGSPMMEEPVRLIEPAGATQGRPHPAVSASPGRIASPAYCSRRSLGRGA